jgi:hypothetical protein
MWLLESRGIFGRGLKSGRRLRSRMPRECLWIFLVGFNDAGVTQLTTSSLGQLGQAQQGIIAWDRLECDVGMPALFSALFLLGLEEQFVTVDFLGLFGGDDADFVVFAAEFATGVGDGVDVEL